MILRWINVGLVAGYGLFGVSIAHAELLQGEYKEDRSYKEVDRAENQQEAQPIVEESSEKVITKEEVKQLYKNNPLLQEYKDGIKYRYQTYEPVERNNQIVVNRKIANQYQGDNSYELQQKSAFETRRKVYFSLGAGVSFLRVSEIKPIEVYWPRGIVFTETYAGEGDNNVIISDTISLVNAGYSEDLSGEAAITDYSSKKTVAGHFALGKRVKSVFLVEAELFQQGYNISEISLPVVDQSLDYTIERVGTEGTEAGSIDKKFPLYPTFTDSLNFAGNLYTLFVNAGLYKKTSLSAGDYQSITFYATAGVGAAIYSNIKESFNYVLAYNFKGAMSFDITDSARIEAYVKWYRSFSDVKLYAHIKYGNYQDEGITRSTSGYRSYSADTSAWGISVPIDAYTIGLNMQLVW